MPLPPGYATVPVTAGAAAFTLQSVVLEYVTDRLVEKVGDEIEQAVRCSSWSSH